MEYKTPKGYSAHYDHFVDFFNGIRNGTPVIEGPEFGLRAAGPSLAANMSYFENRVIEWNPEEMKVLK